MRQWPRLRRLRRAIGRGRPAGAEWFASWRVLARAFALVAGPAPRTAGGYLGLALALNLLPVAQVWLTRRTVNALVDGLGTAALLAAALYGLTLLLAAALQPVQDVLMAGLEERAVAAVDRSIMAAGVRLPDLRRVESGSFGDDLKLIEESHYRAPRLFWVLPPVLGGIAGLIGLLALLGRLQPLLPLALVAATVPHVLAERRLNALKYNSLEERSRPAREMDYAVRLLTDPGAAKELRVFGQGDFFLRRFRDRFARVLTESDRERRAELRSALFAAALQAAALAGGFLYVAVQAGDGRLTLGDIALYLATVAQVESRLINLSVALRNLHLIRLHVGGLFRFLDGAAPAIRLAPPAAARPAPATFVAGIALRDVRFRYGADTPDVLDGVTAILPAGRVTALVGVNGAGKSTLVKLLTRMDDPTAGEIVLDGLPLAAYDLESLRRRVAVVYQDFARFALTLGDNIAVGAVTGERAMGVAEAARRAGADAVAAKLPQGYATELTRRFEGGVDLSGGEWQKVATARAFLRDAALVILDEPTAALDADAEYRLFQQFRELAAGKTALLISHRFSTVRMADQILVLEDGRIIEAGGHADLMALGGRYASLYEMQAGRYQ